MIVFSDLVLHFIIGAIVGILIALLLSYLN